MISETGSEEDCVMTTISFFEKNISWKLMSGKLRKTLNFPSRQNPARCGVFCFFVTESIARGVKPVSSQRDVATLRRWAENWLRSDCMNEM